MMYLDSGLRLTSASDYRRMASNEVSVAVPIHEKCGAYLEQIVNACHFGCHFGMRALNPILRNWSSKE